MTSRRLVWFASGAVVVPAVVVFLALALAGEPDVPHVFVSGTTARASEVNANFASLQDAVKSLVPRRTSFWYRSDPRYFLELGWTVVAPVGAFTKMRDDTQLVVHWQPVGAQDQDHDLRLDGQPHPEDTFAYVSRGRRLQVFDGVPAGEHRLDVYKDVNLVDLPYFGAGAGWVLVEEAYGTTATDGRRSGWTGPAVGRSDPEPPVHTHVYTEGDAETWPAGEPGAVHTHTILSDVPPSSEERFGEALGHTHEPGDV